MDFERMCFVRGWALALLAGGLTLALAAGCAASKDAKQTDENRTSASPNSVSSEEINEHPETSVQELLTGRVAGVVVSEQGSGITVRIRGTSSILGSNEPLYIVDGFPTEPGAGGHLSINPYDVKSINVLKGSDASVYGVRGANGVIIITTKRGNDR